MEEIVEQMKWTTASYTKASYHPKKVMLWTWRNWKGVLYYGHLLKSQMMNSNKYCSQLNQLKVALDEKHLELVSRKCIISHPDTIRLYVCFLGDQAKAVTAWLGSSDSLAIFTIHCIFGCPFISVFTNVLMENISIPWETLKGTWNVLCSKR